MTIPAVPSTLSMRHSAGGACLYALPWGWWVWFSYQVGRVAVVWEVDGGRRESKDSFVGGACGPHATPLLRIWWVWCSAKRYSHFSLSCFFDVFKFYCRFCNCRHVMLYAFRSCNVLCRSRALNVCNGGFWGVFFRILGIQSLTGKFWRHTIRLSGGSAGCCCSSYVR